MALLDLLAPVVGLEVDPEFLTSSESRPIMRLKKLVESTDCQGFLIGGIPVLAAAAAEDSSPLSWVTGLDSKCIVGRETRDSLAVFRTLDSVKGSLCVPEGMVGRRCTGSGWVDVEGSEALQLPRSFDLAALFGMQSGAGSLSSPVVQDIPDMLRTSGYKKSGFDVASYTFRATDDVEERSPKSLSLESKSDIFPEYASLADTGRHISSFSKYGDRGLPKVETGRLSLETPGLRGPNSGVRGVEMPKGEGVRGLIEVGRVDADIGGWSVQLLPVDLRSS